MPAGGVPQGSNVADRANKLQTIIVNQEFLVNIPVFNDFLSWLAYYYQDGIAQTRQPATSGREDMQELSLYYLPSCPYCLKVLRYMEQNGIVIDLRSTIDSDNLDTLLAVGKKNQVPCLFINGEALYESDDIIKYLGQRFGIS
jgi:glutaredoxin